MQIDIVSDAREEWRSIVGWAGYYEVSSLGRVRSLPREVPISGSWYKPAHIRHKAGQVLSPSFDTCGYPMVKLKGDGRVKLVRVHSLVAEAFIGPRPEGMTVAHNDGNPKNPRVTNLRYATIADNFSDKVAHGTRTAGERHGRSKLTQRQVEEIRAAPGTHSSIAKRYGVSQAHVTNLKLGKRWNP